MRDPAPPRAPAPPVAWHPDLTALRRALPAGSAVGIGASGITVSLIGERHVFPNVDAALDWATTPIK